MAAPNVIEALAAATYKYLTEGGFRDNIFRFPKLLSLYKANGAYKGEDGGVQLQIPIMYGVNPTVTSASPTGYDSINIQQTNEHTAALFPWATWHGAFAMSKMEIFQNSGESRLINLMQSKQRNLEMATAQDLNDALYTGSTSKVTNCLGLDQLIEATGVIGGIDSATWTFWRSFVNSTSTALTTSLMDSAYLNAYRNIDAPDVFLTTQTLFLKYNDLAEAKVSVYIPDAKIAELGFEMAQYKGKPVVYDDSAASGDMYLLNWNNIALYHGNGFDFAVSPQTELPTQHVFAFKMIWIGQQAVDNRRMHSRLRGKTT